MDPTPEKPKPCPNCGKVTFSMLVYKLIFSHAYCPKCKMVWKEN